MSFSNQVNLPKNAGPICENVFEGTQIPSGICNKPFNIAVNFGQLLCADLFYFHYIGEFSSMNSLLQVMPQNLCLNTDIDLLIFDDLKHFSFIKKQI